MLIKKKKEDLRFGMLTLDQLKSLGKPNGNLHEKDDSQSFFREALKAYKEEMNASKRNLQKTSKDICRDAYNKMKESFLRPRKSQIAFIGEGIGRCVFAVKNSQSVCKFAIDEVEGILQNKQEVTLLNKYRGWPCFVELDDYDNVNFYGIQEEACASIEGKDEYLADQLLSNLGFKTGNLGSKFNAIGTILQALAMFDRDVEQTLDYIFSKFGYFSRFLEHEIKAFCYNVLDKSTAQAKVLCDLIRFYEDSPKNIEIVQDSHIGNWAYAYRYGEITCILIDLGL